MAGTVTGAEIGWIAGFLEGEGHFAFQHGSARIRVTQVQRQPLERLVVLVGGSIHDRPAASSRNQPYSVWWCGGRLAIALMMSVYALMSPKRKSRIADCLGAWRSGPGQGWHRTLTHCKYGHPFTERYWRLGGKGQQICVYCRELYNRSRRHPLSPEQRRELAASALRARWAKARANGISVTGKPLTARPLVPREKKRHGSGAERARIGRGRGAP